MVSPQDPRTHARGLLSQVVILAGYSDEMKTLLAQNPGLRSRFPNVIDFENYTSEELQRIARGILTEQARPGPLLAASIHKGTRVLISLWDSLMFGRVPG